MKTPALLQTRSTLPISSSATAASRSTDARSATSVCTAIDRAPPDFVAILDLLPKGKIQVLRPGRDEAPSSYEVDIGGTMDLGCYEIADEVGHEVLKMFATRTPQDFRAMFETPNTRGRLGDLSALEEVLASTFTATRSSQTTQPEGAATTRSILIRVTPN